VAGQERDRRRRAGQRFLDARVLMHGDLLAHIEDTRVRLPAR
jgi:hypothetical protein